MTSGEFIRQKYNLKGKYVVYTKIYGIAYEIYIIFYRSKNIDIPITNYEIRQKADTILSIKRDPFNKEMYTFPLNDLDKLRDSLKGAIIICVDLDGRYGNEDNRVHRNIKESIEHSKEIKEWVTFSNLNTVDSISNFTKNFRSIRNKKVGTENFTAKLIACQYNKDDDSVLFLFGTKPTYPSTKKHKVMKVDPDNNFAIVPNPQEEYEVYFKILDFMKWLKDTRPDSLNGKPITWREIKDVLQVAYVQTFCNCVSFFWQGIDYWLSQLDGSIYPTDIEPKRWNAPHLHGDGNAFLCKHSYGIIRYIDFFGNNMASMLNKQLKIQGVI